MFLSFSNQLKVGLKWILTGQIITKEKVERAVIEQAEDKYMSNSEEQNSPK